MRTYRRFAVFAGASLALALVGSACSGLRDTQPFTQTMTIDDRSGKLVLDPLVLHGDASFGLIQVVNNTQVKRGFAIDDLAIYETIPSGQTKTINIEEAKNHKTYIIRDNLKGQEKDFHVQLVIEYKAENER